jgi:hypothetical protein
VSRTDLYECGACADLVIGVLTIGDASYPNDGHLALGPRVELLNDRRGQVSHRGTAQTARLALVLALGKRREGGERGVRIEGIRRGGQRVCLNEWHEG